jgi:hypothetical protein
MTVNTYRSESTQTWETEGGAERLERGGLCRLLKLRQMATKGVHKKGVYKKGVLGPFLSGTLGLDEPVQKIFVPTWLP